MNSRDQLKRDIARLVLHPRFGCLRAYCGDDWEERKEAMMVLGKEMTTTIVLFVQTSVH